jgi:hypothetical protein
MIMAVGILVFVSICALSLVGMGKAHTRVSRILSELDTELDNNSIEEDSPNQAPALGPPAPYMDVFGEVGFTRSLLALGKVRLLDPYESPKLEPAESSSLVSVRRARSRSRARLL